MSAWCQSKAVMANCCSFTSAASASSACMATPRISLKAPKNCVKITLDGFCDEGHLADASRALQR